MKISDIFGTQGFPISATGQGKSKDIITETRLQYTLASTLLRQTGLLGKNFGNTLKSFKQAFAKMRVLV